MAKDPPISLNQTVDDDGAFQNAKRDVKPWLLVVYGNDRGTHIQLEELPLTIGRSLEARIVLNDTLVSRVHCTVSLNEAGQVEVVDLKSHNGLFVNEQRVERAILTPKCHLRLGRTVLRVEHKAPEEVKLEEELFVAATTDPLTGAQNRRSFLDRARSDVANALRHGVPLSLAFLDVDHFKRINDERGHAAGDAVLRDLASRLRDNLREDDLYCRYGGEEFVILLRNTPLDGALLVCERIRSHIAEVACDFAGQKIPVTISAGVTALRAGDTLEHLLQRADAALYRAKDQGRNRVLAASDPL